MNSLTKIKKSLGRLARRMGGERYARLRRVAVHLASLPAEYNAVWRLRRGCPKRESEDATFLDRYYTESPSLTSAGVAPGIVCMYDGRMYHGGLTDRLRGVLSTYQETRRRGLPFYIHWTHPFELTDYLLPAEVDWRISPQQLSYSRHDSWPIIIQDKGKTLSRMRLCAGIARHAPQTHVYSNAFTAKGDYRRLYHELFRPAPAVSAEIERHLRILGKEYSVYTFRFLTLLGDFHDHSHTVLTGSERRAFIERVLTEFRRMLADEPAGRRVLVTSDSVSFLKEACAADERVYVVEGDVKHIDVDGGDHREAWLKVFVDQGLIMHGSKVVLMRTGGMYRSGFGEFAAEVGGIPFIDHRF